MNTNTFRSVFDYLSITKKSNAINVWLLGINSAILVYIIKNFMESSKHFNNLLDNSIVFKVLTLLLFFWITINVIILIIFSYKEKMLSLVIEDKFYRLKSFISYMDNIKKISEDELLDTDMFYLDDITSRESTKRVLKEYSDKIRLSTTSLLKWSNKRLLIYRFVILAFIPLLFCCIIIVLSNLEFSVDEFLNIN